MKKADIGMIGLAVMGENLSLNMESKGFTVAVYDRFPEIVDGFMNGRGKGKNFIGAYTVEELAGRLSSPRIVMFMIKAGSPVDETIEKLIPFLEAGDIIIDGGNSNFQDTARRTAYAESKGLLYVGTGVSGGGEGALKGPSMMPGGSPEAWKHVAPIFRRICARADGEPCCDWVGRGGAGHFVKMVHNGIEYGDMQLICEAYQIMRDGLGMSADEMSGVFSRYNEGELDSYLIQITRDILAYREDGEPVLDRILDTAGQKGTGKWTGIAALNEGVPLTLISEAVFARCLSAEKEERVGASAVLRGPRLRIENADADRTIADIGDALLAAKIVSYAQGFTLLRSAAKTYGWDLNYGAIALMWRGGCIIRSTFLGRIKEAFERDGDLANLMLDPYFRDVIDRAQAGWRRVCALAIQNGIPAPAMTAALAYYDGYRCGRLPANLLQAQRDYFGSHTYERTDRPRGEFFHTDWIGMGDGVSSTSYNA